MKLIEHVSGVRDMLAGKEGRWQVVDFGRHGWFRVYSAVPVDDAAFAGLALAHGGKKEAAAFLSRVHTQDDYVDGRMQTPPSFVPDDMVEKTDLGEYFQRATDSMIAVGIPKQTSTVVYGGPIIGKYGGSATGVFSKKQHVIQLSRKVRDTYITPIHELMHQVWYNLPKSSRDWFKQFFRLTVLKPALPAGTSDELKALAAAMKSSKKSKAAQAALKLAVKNKASPTAYGATQYAELWTELVSYAAERPKQVTRALRKAMYGMFSGALPPLPETHRLPDDAASLTEHVDLLSRSSHNDAARDPAHGAHTMNLKQAVAGLFETTVTATVPADKLNESADPTAALAVAAGRAMLKKRDDKATHVVETEGGTVVVGEAFAVQIAESGAVTVQPLPDEYIAECACGGHAGSGVRTVSASAAYENAGADDFTLADVYAWTDVAVLPNIDADEHRDTIRAFDEAVRHGDADGAFEAMATLTRAAYATADDAMEVAERFEVLAARSGVTERISASLIGAYAAPVLGAYHAGSSPGHNAMRMGAAAVGVAGAHYGLKGAKKLWKAHGGKVKRLVNRVFGKGKARVAKGPRKFGGNHRFENDGAWESPYAKVTEADYNAVSDKVMDWLSAEVTPRLAPDAAREFATQFDGAVREGRYGDALDVAEQFARQAGAEDEAIVEFRMMAAGTYNKMLRSRRKPQDAMRKAINRARRMSYRAHRSIISRKAKVYRKKTSNFRHRGESVEPTTFRVVTGPVEGIETLAGVMSAATGDDYDVLETDAGAELHVPDDVGDALFDFMDEACAADDVHEVEAVIEGRKGKRLFGKAAKHVKGGGKSANLPGTNGGGKVASAGGKPRLKNLVGPGADKKGGIKSSTATVAESDTTCPNCEEGKLAWDEDEEAYVCPECDYSTDELPDDDEEDEDDDDDADESEQDDEDGVTVEEAAGVTVKVVRRHQKGDETLYTVHDANRGKIVGVLSKKGSAKDESSPWRAFKYDGGGTKPHTLIALHYGKDARTAALTSVVKAMKEDARKGGDDGDDDAASQVKLTFPRGRSMELQTAAEGIIDPTELEIDEDGNQMSVTLAADVAEQLKAKFRGSGVRYEPVAA